jgi:flagellar motor switch/type III secretory pathway protein FliN
VSEPVELLVHGRVVARGELVEVKGNYGFRVKHIVSRQELLEFCNS